jgi:hydroxypyruvate isomerase
MQRRKFMQQPFLAGASIVAASSLQANNITQRTTSLFHLNYAIHDGMFAEKAGKTF